jgi:hypothetical protein
VPVWWCDGSRSSNSPSSVRRCLHLAARIATYGGADVARMPYMPRPYRQDVGSHPAHSVARHRSPASTNLARSAGARLHREVRKARRRTVYPDQRRGPPETARADRGVAHSDQEPVATRSSPPACAVPGDVRLIERILGWDCYVRLAFDELRLAGAASPQVPRRLRAALEDLRPSVDLASAARGHQARGHHDRRRAGPPLERPRAPRERHAIEPQPCATWSRVSVSTVAARPSTSRTGGASPAGVHPGLPRPGRPGRGWGRRPRDRSRRVSGPGPP